MSFVTTASDRSWARAWQSAATSAVFPEPTGPPMPIRSGRAVSGRAACGSSSGCGWVCGGSSVPCGRSWSGRKETHLPGGVVLGTDVEQRSAVRGQVVGLAVGEAGTDRGGGVAVGRERGEYRLDRVGVERQQSHGRGGRPGDRTIGGGQRGLEG